VPTGSSQASLPLTNPLVRLYNRASVIVINHITLLERTVRVAQTRSRFPSLHATLLLAACLLFSSAGRAQQADPKDPQNVQRGRDLVKQAIEARGGARYLNFKTLEATGQYTPFDQGSSTVPMPFFDWIAYPDKERVEFGKGKKKDRRIQVNVGKTGWVYDGDAETLKDQTEKQIKDFLEGIEFDLDHLLRVTAQQPDTQIRFYGRQETRPGERADVVEFKLAAGQLVYLTLDRSTHLPMSLSYEKTSDKGLSKREVRYFQYISYGGIKFPNILDFYNDGIQESRVNYQSVKTDVPIPDELFAKPASVKALK
jgi:outer membrane lipoprotein-sorting protein